MDTKRIEDYLHRVVPSGDRAGSSGSGLGELCAEVAGVHGAGIMLMVDGSHRGCLSASDSTMAVVEDLQFTLGEGPCIDAFATGEAVLEPDLRRVTGARWPLFAGPAVEAGVAAVFAFPVLAGGTCLGALDLYNLTPGMLDDSQLSEAWVVAGMACDVVLSMQADAESGEVPAAFLAAIEGRTVAYQAAGMIAVQLDIPLDDALVRLRAHAFAFERSVNDVGRDIVDRTLVLAGSGPGVR